MTKKNIEAVYELSPLQQGMQFQSLLAPESGSYFQQLYCRIEGELDYKAFRDSWQMITDRHDILRTAFVWEGLDKVLQVVKRNVELNVDEINLEYLKEEEKERSVSDYLQADKKKGLDMTKAPLMRVSLLKLGDDEHVLIWSHHHILLDGWSVTTLLKEVFAIYGAKIKGEIVELPEVVPYRNYINWIKRQSGEKTEKFWTDKLSRFNHATRLAVQKDVPQKNSNNQTHIEIQKILSKEETAQIAGFARENRLTINTLTQAAWAYVLSRYSNELNVIFGATVNGRPNDLEKSENMVGLFINTLPVSVELHPEKNTKDWLTEIQNGQREIEEYSYSSLVDIQGWSSIPRGTPLFESILVFENFPLTDTAKASEIGIKLKEAHLIEQTNYPLTLIAVPGEEMVLMLSYNPVLFDEETARRLLLHWAKVIKELASESCRRLSDIKLLASDEERNLLNLWQGKSGNSEKIRCIHSLFEIQAKKTPEAVAAITETEEINYAGLNSFANKIAHHLIKNGIKTEAKVGVCLERSWQMIAAILGIVKAGATYVPLNAELPAERLKFMYRDSEIRHLISERKLFEKLPESEFHILLLDGEENDLDALPSSNPDVEVSPKNSAYIIYTSGSTGEPKGVVVEHAGLVNFTLEVIDELGLQPTDRMLQFAPLSFDASAIQIYPPLLSGAAVVLNRRVTEITNLELLDYCLEKKVTVLDVPSGYWHQWIDEIDSLNMEIDENFRIFMTGGDRLSIDKLKQWARLAKNNALFLSSYGPTETTVSATVFTTTRDEVRSDKIENSQIGKPLGNVQTYVLDAKWFQAVPVGVGGELFIGGSGLARNYLNSPDLTAEKFIPDPFTFESGARLYKTGDSVKVLADGSLEFLGRFDQQVKIRGIRIEIGEIESALRIHDDISEAVVIAENSNNGGEKKLVGYLKPVADADLTIHSIREHLKDLIPEHMIPTSFKIVKDFPLLSSGKINRKEIPELEKFDLGNSDEFVLPKNPIEESVLEVWKEVLKLEKISVNESFFALGGHSLIATQLISRVRNLFNLEIPVQNLFDNPTIAEFSALIEKDLTDEREAAVSKIQKRQRPETIPLSLNQERLWFIDRMLGENSIFNLVGIVRLEGKLDKNFLKKSIDGVIAKHEILRTNFREEKGLPRQIIAEEGNITLETIEVSAASSDAISDAIRGFVKKESETAFDLEKDALLRGRLLSFGDDKYALILTIHHIVCDGWSMGILVREITNNYKELSEGRKDASPELFIQYADYALWQRDYFENADFRKNLDYWREKLTGMPPVLEITTDFSRPVEQTYTGSQEVLELSENLTALVKKIARTEGATLFMVLLAAFKSLIHKYTGSNDIVIGTPTAGRQSLETENLIGFFLNTLVLRTEFSAQSNFKEVLQSVKETCLAAYKHQNVTFENLIKLLNPERDRSRSPLVQIMFNMLNFDEPKVELENLTIEGLAPEDQWSKFDLTLYASEKNEKIFLNLVYNVDLYSPQTVRRILKHFENLLTAVAADQKTQLNAIEIFSENEIDDLYKQHQPAAVRNYERFENLKYKATLDEQFAESKNLNPQAIAVKSSNHTMTYESLERISTRIAGALKELKAAQKNESVALFFNHGVEMICAMLGVLKANCFYVPLDSNNPRKRLIEIMGDAQSRCILTNDELHEAALELKSQIEDRDITVVNIENLPERESSESEMIPNAPDFPAYILYTSGSTGIPKGVYQNHKNVLSHILTYTKSLNIKSDDRILLLASYGFDASVMDIYGALLNGAQLHLYDVRKNGTAGLSGFIAENKITVYHSTPTVFRAFTSDLSPGTIFSNVRAVVLGGEETRGSDLTVFSDHFPHDAVFVNGLGPTESTLALQYFAENGQPLNRQTVPVGYPVAETQIHLLEKGRRTGIWGTGEIAIESARLALGYWNQPELTSEKFTVSGNDPAKRLYLTGDIGRRLPNHGIEFLGRSDSQVKIRGQRIETGEVESQISALDGVKSVVVAVQHDSKMNGFLVAYIVPSDETVSNPADIRNGLREKLPEFMIPQYFQFVEELPLTVTGKIDRKALPKIDLENIPRGEDYFAPRNSTEEILQGIWQSILNLEKISVKDDFFSIGGHSLIATQIISGIREAFDLNVELREIFENPTIEKLAEKIKERENQYKNSAAQKIPARAGDEYLPLANAQKRLWFLDELEPGNPAYNMSVGFRVEGFLDVPALHESIERIIDRHESLRTVIRTENGKPFQVVNEFSKIELNLRDIDDSDEYEKEKKARELVKQEIRTPFDLSEGPLFRHLLVRLSEDRFMLVFTLHHIICDGWSIGVFTRELAKTYMGLVKNESSGLSNLEVQYADFAVWQNESLTGEELQYQVDYWKEQLGDELSPLKLPYDRPRPNELTFKGAHLSFKIENELITELKKICRQNGVTMFMLMLSAWKVLFMRYCNQNDIVVGIPVAGRSQQETENLIGMFVNTLVIKTALQASDNFEDVLKQVKKVCLEAYAHQDLPFETLVSALQPTRDLSRVPLFEVMFNWLNFYENPEEIARSTSILSEVGLSLEPLTVENSLTKFDISLILSEGDSGISGTVEYNTLLFDDSTIERMLGNFDRLLRSIIDKPEEKIGSLEIISGSEREKIFELNPIETEDSARFLTARQLFENRTDAAPERIAVVFGDEKISYADLDKKANRLANYLIEKGVGVEDKIGICLERSVNMVVSVLGVVKSGAAYVPLDPELPPARLDYIREDSGIKFLITDRRVAESFSERENLLLPFDAQSDSMKMQSDDRPPNSSVPENLFYIIYTSGSTGLPKGAMNTHKGVLNRQIWMQKNYPLNETDAVLQLASFSFDFSNWEIFGTLSAGAKLVLPESGSQRDLEYISGLIQKENVTNVHFVPSQMQLFMDQGKPENCGSLKRVFSGGEELSLKLYRRFFGAFDIELVNQYGPTECSIDVTFWNCDRDFSGASVPIGIPNDNNKIYILNEYLNPVPLGSVGEIYIGGEAVGRGYVNQPSMTAERFLPDPFDSGSGARMYKTGDLGRINSENAVEYRGRVDNQIQLRGFRIELGEVEKVLLAMRGIEEIVVDVFRSDEDDARLAAYIVASDGDGLSVNDIRNFAADRLPAYMIPSYFVMLEHLPLTQSGKVNRLALPRPDENKTELGNDYIAPANDIEEALSRVWADVLKLEKVGVNDNFFALGGDSILSIQIVVKAREHGLNFNPREIFKYQTIAELAPFADFEPQIEAEQGTLDGELPLSPIQIDFFERNLSEPDHYNQSILLDLGSEINVSAIEKSLEFLLLHHDALRIKFTKSGEIRRQFYSPDVNMNIFGYSDISNLEKTPRETALEKIINDIQTDLKIDEGDLFRAHLLNLGDEGYRLLLVAHHLIIDGVSWRIVAEHLSRLYKSAIEEKPLSLDKKSGSYRQWSQKFIENFENAEAERKAEIWLGREGISAAKLAPDNPRGENLERHTARISKKLNGEETARLLGEVPKAYDVQITDILLTAWSKAVAEFNGGESILIALEGHGRNEIETLDVTETVGWFTTITPVLLENKAEISLSKQVRENASTIKKSLDNGLFYRQCRYLGREEHREFLKREWEPEVSFNYLGQIRNSAKSHSEWKIASENFGNSKSENNERRYDIDVVLIVVDGCLEASVSFSSERYEKGKMEALASIFAEKIKQLINESDSAPEAYEAGETYLEDLDEILEEVEFEF